MTIGRIGCFLGGCCVGLPTSSRWGVWSSDRRLGVRRIPVQLFESTLAGLLGVTALLAILFTNSSVDGVIFVAALAAYTLGRQLLFPMRGIPRKTAYGRMLTMVVMALAVVAALAVAVFV
ncbi:MAG: prolipoprotein diacylglyceryl transferase family protein [Geodermatophilaceae bacterium]